MRKQHIEPTRFYYDTSKEGMEKIGIFLNDEQYSDLICLSDMLTMAIKENRQVLYIILLILKSLGLLPKNKESVPKSELDTLSLESRIYQYERKFGCRYTETELLEIQRRMYLEVDE